MVLSSSRSALLLIWITEDSWFLHKKILPLWVQIDLNLSSFVTVRQALKSYRFISVRLSARYILLSSIYPRSKVVFPFSFLLALYRRSLTFCLVNLTMIGGGPTLNLALMQKDFLWGRRWLTEMSWSTNSTSTSLPTSLIISSVFPTVLVSGIPLISRHSLRSYWFFSLLTSRWVCSCFSSETCCCSSVCVPFFNALFSFQRDFLSSLLDFILFHSSSYFASINFEWLITSSSDFRRDVTVVFSGINFSSSFLSKILANYSADNVVEIFVILVE